MQEEKNQYRLPAEVLQGFISSFSTSIDADIFITDLKGNILAGNYPNSKLQSPVQVPEQAVGNKELQLMVLECEGDLKKGENTSTAVTLMETREVEEPEISIVEDSAEVVDGYVTCS